MPRAAAARRAPGLRGNRPLQLLIAGYTLLWIALAIAPKYRSDWLLENLLVFAFVVLAAVYGLRRRPWSATPLA